MATGDRRSGYDVFISYSHDPDHELAERCQKVLQSLRRRYLGRPALQVFRDGTSLASSPDLWASIVSALSSSRWFLLVASPRSATSTWVKREVQAWLEHHSADTLLIVLVDGAIHWSDGDFDWERTTALPQDVLSGVFTAEPLWVDLTWARERDDLDENDVRLRDAVATLAAPVHGVPKDELESADIRELRRGRRLRGIAVAALSVLLVLALVGAVVATVQATAARREATTAIMNKVQIEADRLRDRDVGLAAQLDLVADRDRPTPDTRNRLTAAATSPLSGPTDVDADVLSAAYSPDGRTAAIGAEDGSITLWNVTEPTHPIRWAPSTIKLEAQVNSLAYNRDGTVLAVGSALGRLSLWDVADPVRPVPLVGVQVGEEPVVAVAHDPASGLLATGSADNTTRLWNVSDPRRPLPVGTAVAGYRGLSFRPDGKVLAVGDLQSNAVHLWDLTDPTRPVPAGPDLVGHEGTVNASQFSPDGRTLVSGGGDRRLVIWDVAQPGAPRTHGSYEENSNAVRAVAFSPDGSRLLSAGADRTMRLWRLPPAVLLGVAGAVRDVAYGPGGRLLVTADNEGAVQLRDATDPGRPATIEQPLQTGPIAVSRLALGLDGAVLGTVFDDGRAALWSVDDPALPAPLAVPVPAPISPVRSIAVGGAGGRVLALGSDDGTVQLWDLLDPARPRPLAAPLTGHDGSVNAVAFAPDGHRLATAGEDGTLRTWDVTTPAGPRPEPDVVTGHTQPVDAIAFSPDGRFVASASRDQTVGIHDLREPMTPRLPLVGHTDSVRAVSFSPDGRRIATGGVDRTVRLWSFSAGASAADGEPLVGHTDEVRTVAFEPRSGLLLSGALDGSLRLWPLAPDTSRGIVCASAPRALTPEAWTRYVSEERPYDPPCPS